MTAGPRIRLAVVFGGRSAEHGVSCVSAGSVLAAIDRERYEVAAVGIGRDGRWVLLPPDPARLSVQGGVMPDVGSTGAALMLPGDPTSSGLVALDGSGPLPGLDRVDVVFPLLHGPYGEDGTIQGLLELAGVPYVGSGVFASAACMDKEFMKVLLTARGLPVGRYQVVHRSEWETDREGVLDRLAELDLPVFVKPARGGSSLGIGRADDRAGLGAAVDVAAGHDPKVLVEVLVEGREIECAVLDGVDGGPPEASLPAEIHVGGGHDFYDFEAKYFDDAGTRFDVPAALPDADTERVRAAAVRAYRALGCESLARVDFFLRPDGELIVNEINTMPGFTPASMFPRMWAASGVDYPTLVDRLVRGALARGTGLR